MKAFYLEKDFYDYADDIEGVNIRCAWTPLGGIPDWASQRVTRFMPLVPSPAPCLGAASLTQDPDAAAESEVPRWRKKVLKLPSHMQASEDGTLTDRDLLHHYFEIFQDGYRLYSPLFSAAIVTGALARPEAQPESATAATLIPANRGEA